MSAYTDAMGITTGTDMGGGDVPDNQEALKRYLSRLQQPAPKDNFGDRLGKFFGTLLTPRSVRPYVNLVETPEDIDRKQRQQSLENLKGLSEAGSIEGMGLLNQGRRFDLGRAPVLAKQEDADRTRKNAAFDYQSMMEKLIFKQQAAQKIKTDHPDLSDDEVLRMVEQEAAGNPFPKFNKTVSLPGMGGLNLGTGAINSGATNVAMPYIPKPSVKPPVLKGFKPDEDVFEVSSGTPTLFRSGNPKPNVSQEHKTAMDGWDEQARQDYVEAMSAPTDEKQLSAWLYGGGKTRSHNDAFEIANMKFQQRQRAATKKKTGSQVVVGGVTADEARQQAQAAIKKNPSAAAKIAARFKQLYQEDLEGS